MHTDLRDVRLPAGAALFELAVAHGYRGVSIVGTGKNAGKTVVMRAIAAAAAARGKAVGLTLTGRDGEMVDALDGGDKPRLFLRPGAIIATARSVLPAHPACEILDVTGWRAAAGEIVFARVRRAGYFELAGPATAAGTRACVHGLALYGSDFVVVDGAIDRIAALAGSEGAVIVAVGASGVNSMQEAVHEAQALCARLRVCAFDPQMSRIFIEGALTPARAAQLQAQKESRQIVVRDPTRVAASGKTLLGMLQHLDVRCRRPLNVIAVTVASIGREHYFDPRAFARSVAAATGLPTYDVFAASMVRAA